MISRLLNDMGIYAGMNSIVLADNAAKTRLDTRAVIIHMQSNFHKRAAMAYCGGSLLGSGYQARLSETAFQPVR